MQSCETLSNVHEGLVVTDSDSVDNSEFVHCVLRILDTRSRISTIFPRVLLDVMYAQVLAHIAMRRRGWSSWLLGNCSITEACLSHTSFNVVFTMVVCVFAMAVSGALFPVVRALRVVHVLYFLQWFRIWYYGLYKIFLYKLYKKILFQFFIFYFLFFIINKLINIQ